MLFLEDANNEDIRRTVLAGRAYFRAFVETAMMRLGAPGPVAAATAITAMGEGMIIRREAVDPDAEVFAPIDAVVRAFVRSTTVNFRVYPLK